MSKQRKISECVNVRINVGNYQHIEITKYAEESISYETEEERVALEEELTNDLVTGIIRSMRTIPEKLGKGVSNAQEVEEEIINAIPEWLDNHQTPNIATTSNKAQDKINRVAAEQKDNKDQASEDILDVDEEQIGTPGKTLEDMEERELEVEGDLFEDDEPPAEPEVAEETETAPEVAKSSPAETEPVKVEEKKTEAVVENDDFSDFFDDDDLFDD